MSGIICVHKYIKTIILTVICDIIFSINAGCLALPALLNIKHVMKQRKIGNIWNEKEELPVCCLNTSIKK